MGKYNHLKQYYINVLELKDNYMKDEKLFPISINFTLCVRCERCIYSCPQKAIFFKDSMRFVDYDKCKECLKCVNVCEHGAIEVISIEQGRLKGFSIHSEKCTLCKICLKEDFCFQNLFKLQKEKNFFSTSFCYFFKNRCFCS